MARKSVKQDLAAGEFHKKSIGLWAILWLAATALLFLLVNYPHFEAPQSSVDATPVLLVWVIMSILYFGLAIYIARLNRTFGATNSLIGVTLRGNSDLVNKAIAQSAQELQRFFKREQAVQRVDENDVTAEERKQLNFLRGSIERDKERFWELRTIAVRWGIELPDTIDACAKLTEKEVNPSQRMELETPASESA